MLGIIGAMDVEVKKLREMMEDPETQTVAGMTFYQGTIKGKAVVVVRSGIGKVNAGLCSQILVDRYHVSGIINTGIAGSLRNEVNVGDIVLATDAVQHDMDAAGFGSAGRDPADGHQGVSGRCPFKGGGRQVLSEGQSRYPDLLRPRGQRRPVY